MDIPSTPGWETQSTEINGEPKIFLTLFYIPELDERGNLTGKDIEYGGRVIARSFEEANSIAESIKIPRTVVTGILGGTVNLYMMN